MNLRKLFFSSFVIVAVFTVKVFSQVQPVKVNFTSHGSILNAEIYHVSTYKPMPTIILLHGYPGGEGDPLGLGNELSSLGINVFVFNYRGTWSSEGEFSFDSSIKDIGTALNFLKREENIEKFNIDTTCIIVGGYSYGGAMALTAALYNNNIKRIISIAGADESVFGRKMLKDESYRKMFIQMLKETEYPNGPIKTNIDSLTNYWLANLDKYDQVMHADSIKNRDILLLGGFDDNDVLLEEHILPLYRKLKELKANHVAIRVFNSDHSFKNVREELADTIFTWIVNKD